MFNNILQIALYSSNNHNITHIIFTGSFARNNPFLLKCFGETLKETYRGQLVTKTLVSLGNKDGYLGAIGAVCCLLAKSKEGDGL